METHMYFKFALISSLIALSAISSGCSSSDSNSDRSKGGSLSLIIPTDAVKITADNATTISQNVTSTTNETLNIIGIESSSLPINNTFALISQTLQLRNREPLLAPSGIIDSYNCINAGTITDDYTETATGWSGTYTFSDCDEIGYSVDGSFSYQYLEDDVTADYSDNANGSLKITSTVESFTLAFNFSESGNYDTGDYNIELNYSVSGASIGGFLTETSETLTGQNFNNLSAGQFIVSGAEKSRLRITITSTTTADVELDTGNGTFVAHDSIDI